MHSVSKAIDRLSFRSVRYSNFRYHQTNPEGGYVVTKGDMIIVHVGRVPSDATN